MSERESDNEATQLMYRAAELLNEASKVEKSNSNDGWAAGLVNLSNLILAYGHARDGITYEIELSPDKTDNQDNSDPE